jgi:diguanylate cyclase (GGDEF)-like protein
MSIRTCLPEHAAIPVATTLLPFSVALGYLSMSNVALQLSHFARRGWRKFVEGKYGLYVFIVVPFLTDLVEKGAIPSSLRGWTTELVVGSLIAILIGKLRKGYIDAVALARTDALTGLGNRRAFNERFEIEWARSRRLGAPLSLILIDLDNFKQVNDQFGHDAGDAVLHDVAETIRTAIREKIDSGFRLGGDEFAVLLPASDAREAAVVVARVQSRCARHHLLRNHKTEFSAGIVELGADEPLDELLLRADADMYERKRLRSCGRVSQGPAGHAIAPTDDQVD